MSKLVLVLNCGSSSLKFAVIDAENGREHLSGLAECFNLVDARIKWGVDGNKTKPIWALVLPTAKHWISWSTPFWLKT